MSNLKLVHSAEPIDRLDAEERVEQMSEQLLSGTPCTYSSHDFLITWEVLHGLGLPLDPPDSYRFRKAKARWRNEGMQNPPWWIYMTIIYAIN